MTKKQTNKNNNNGRKASIKGQVEYKKQNS